MADIDNPNVATDELRETALCNLHKRLGARMVPFAGWLMPLQFPAGIMTEHLHCRSKAALFDVSHMAQVSIKGPNADKAIEKLVPGDIVGLETGRQRYTMLTNDVGGIIDDMMIARFPDRLAIVCNASRADIDRTHMVTKLPEGLHLHHHDDRALLALQGPAAEGIMARLAPTVATMRFMDAAETEIAGIGCWVTRSGYTGEDGFEISVPNAQAEKLAEILLAEPDVAPAGLGARDSLRLEAGLALYGNDIDELTSPIEAALGWTMSRRRKDECDFLGGVVVRDHLKNGPTRKLVGLTIEGRVPARAGAILKAQDGTEAGAVTSGGFSPTLQYPIALAYVRRDLAEPGTVIHADVRGQALTATVTKLPFVAHRYKR